MEDNTNYYEQAITNFSSNDRFLVFSDDIEWCKSVLFLQGIQFDFSEGKTVEEDLALMASCKGIIMANSSLSWWGAFLSNANKIIAPNVEHWYTDKIERTVCPKSWIRI